MRQVATTVIGQRTVAQLLWSQHIILMDKIKQPEERSFYLIKSLENGWSRDVLSLQLKGGLDQRQGKAVTNFESCLPTWPSS